MKKFFALMVSVFAVFMLASCGGNSGDEKCNSDYDYYTCDSSGSGFSSYHYWCKKGEVIFGHNWATGNGEAYSDYDIVACSEECSSDSGKCTPVCASGQYKCSESGLGGYDGWIYSCDENLQWKDINEVCEKGCAKEISTSALDLCKGGEVSGNGNGSTEDNGNQEDNSSTEDNSSCTKITPKWTGVDDEEIYDEIVIYGTYTPQTGTNPDYGDTIYFYVEYEDDPKNEYDFASTIDAGVQVLEGLRESDYEETGHDNEWDRAYIAVSGKVQINNFDAENKHFSVSLQNVKLMEATLNREDEDGTWTMVKDGACLVIESSSFEQ